ncbi:MAG: hypothetical protein Q9165_001271 [Trypethelium subeluteriae]
MDCTIKAREFKEGRGSRLIDAGSYFRFSVTMDPANMADFEKMTYMETAVLPYLVDHKDELQKCAKRLWVVLDSRHKTALQRCSLNTHDHSGTLDRNSRSSQVLSEIPPLLEGFAKIMNISRNHLTDPDMSSPMSSITAACGSLLLNMWRVCFDSGFNDSLPPAQLERISSYVDTIVAGSRVSIALLEEHALDLASQQQSPESEMEELLSQFNGYRRGLETIISILQRLLLLKLVTSERQSTYTLTSKSSSQPSENLPELLPPLLKRTRKSWNKRSPSRHLSYQSSLRSRISSDGQFSVFASQADSDPSVSIRTGIVDDQYAMDDSRTPSWGSNQNLDPLKSRSISTLSDIISMYNVSPGLASPDTVSEITSIYQDLLASPSATIRHDLVREQLDPRGDNLPAMDQIIDSEGGFKCKITVLGDGAVGKSPLIQNYVYSRYFEDYDPTIEDLHQTQRIIDGCLIDIEIVDTSGQHDYESAWKDHIETSDAFILVYSITSGYSFEQISYYSNQVWHPRPGVILTPPMILVGNKCDLEQQRVVSKDAGMEYAAEMGCLFEEASAKWKINIDKIFRQVIRAVRVYRDSK